MKFSIGFDHVNRRSISAPLIGFIVCVLPTVSLAAEITYTVDPTQSIINISGTFDGVLLQQQSTGTLPPFPNTSFQTSYMGKITATRDTSSNTIQISGGNIVAQDSGLWAAPVLGPADSAYPFLPPPANYGVYAGVLLINDPLNGGGIQSDLLGAIRNFSFSIASPVIVSAAAFDVSQLFATTTSGELDYVTSEGAIASNLYTPCPLQGGLAFAAANGSLVDDGSIETLTIPVNTSLTFNITDLDISADQIPLDLQLSGTIVATATVPEPVFLSVLTASALLLFRNRRTNSSAKEF